VERYLLRLKSRLGKRNLVAIASSYRANSDKVLALPHKVLETYGLFGTAKTQKTDFVKTMKTKHALSLAFCLLLPCWTNAQILIFSDDFSISNSVWHFALTGTEGNSTAVAASYGTIQGGTLNLKANVGCGYDYLSSWAVLSTALPAEYQIEFSANKLQYCGGFHAWVAITNVAPTNSAAPVQPPQPVYDFYVAGSVFGQLRIRASSTNYDVQPVNSSFSYGTGYNYRIVKGHSSLDVYVNDALQWSYNGPVLDGGTFHFEASGAGATAQIDNFKLYDLTTTLSIYTAIEFGFFAQTNRVYQIEASPDLMTWTNFDAQIQGYGSNWFKTYSIRGQRQSFFRVTPQ